MPTLGWPNRVLEMAGVQRVEVIGDAGRGGDLRVVGTRRCQLLQKAVRIEEVRLVRQALGEGAPGHHEALVRPVGLRSEEHTSELQSLMRISYAVFCLKKKKQKTNNHNMHAKKKVNVINP